MMYYFLPKQSGQPTWSYRLSIVSFWGFVFTYIWAGPHHLHYSAIPRLGAGYRHGDEPDFAAAFLGNNGQWDYDYVWGMGKIARQSFAQIYRVSAGVLWAGDF